MNEELDKGTAVVEYGFKAQLTKTSHLKVLVQEKVAKFYKIIFYFPF